MALLRENKFYFTVSALLRSYLIHFIKAPVRETCYKKTAWGH